MKNVLPIPKKVSDLFIEGNVAKKVSDLFIEGNVGVEPKFR